MLHRLKIQEARVGIEGLLDPACERRARVDSQAVHVGKQGRSSIEEHAAIDHHGSVVAVERESGSATEERELYAMVTAGLR